MVSGRGKPFVSRKGTVATAASTDTAPKITEGAHGIRGPWGGGEGSWSWLEAAE